MKTEKNNKKEDITSILTLLISDIFIAIVFTRHIFTILEDKGVTSVLDTILLVLIALEITTLVISGLYRKYNKQGKKKMEKYVLKTENDGQTLYFTGERYTSNGKEYATVDVEQFAKIYKNYASARERCHEINKKCCNGNFRVTTL